MVVKTITVKFIFFHIKQLSDDSFIGILTSMRMIARQLIMYMHFIDPFNSIFMHVYWEFLTSFFFNGKDFFGYAQLIHIKVG